MHCVEQPDNAGTVKYQAWSSLDQRWDPISEQAIIRMVHQKSHLSTYVRDAVGFRMGERTAALQQFQVGISLGIY